ncbi:MAG TPA: hypothetical protein VKW04_24560 [Planctomycetota bacterium]|nr:hypothetical protein [Planctomycetota bacterium]
MNAEVRFHPDLGYVVTTVKGRITLPELGALVQSVWADPGWKPEYNGIMDFSAATLDLSEREMLELSTSMRADPRCSFGRWAFVVSTASDFGKLRKADHPEDVTVTMRIFFDRRTAEEWLLARKA